MRYLMIMVLLVGPFVSWAWGETYLVCPTPQLGDFPNIQAAINGVVDGDIIELADGVYWNFGNWGIDWGNKEVIIRSQSGIPENCIIDGWAHVGMNFSGFYIHDVDPGAVLDRVTITNGDASAGGGVHVVSASPTITGCAFVQNQAGEGGAIMCGDGALPTITGCTFRENGASQGGGIMCDLGAAPTIIGCTFLDNHGALGPGLCI